MSLNALILKARDRMSKTPYSPHIVYAEIFFLTDAELDEFYRLRRYEIELEGSTSDAADRLAVKIAKRKAGGVHGQHN